MLIKTRPVRPRIGLFGGSFDPIHSGHIMLIHEAIKLARLDSLLIFPTKRSPHKSHSPSISNHHRIALLLLSITDIPEVCLDLRELHRPPPSYTWHTVKHLRRCHPHAQFYWLLGADQWQKLPTWNNASRLRKHLNFIVCDREGRAKKRVGYRAQFLRFEHPASSSKIRDLLERKEKIDDTWLSKKARAYIEKHKLYRPKNLSR